MIEMRQIVSKYGQSIGLQYRYIKEVSELYGDSVHTSKQWSEWINVPNVVLSDDEFDSIVDNDRFSIHTRNIPTSFENEDRPI